MAKIKNQKIIVTTIIILVILFGLFLYKPTKVEAKTSAQDGTGGTSTTMTLTFFDRNGNIVTALPVQAVVGGVAGIASMLIEIQVSNTGAVPLFISIPSSPNPPALALALSISEKTIPVGGTGKWISGLIDTNQLIVDECLGANNCDIWFDVIIDAEYCDPAVIASCSRISLPLQNPSIAYFFQEDDCVDGTPWESCSTDKPLYCDTNLNLVNDCTNCGCSLDYYGNEGLCEVDESCTVQSYDASFTSEVGGVGESVLIIDRITNLAEPVGDTTPVSGATGLYMYSGYCDDVFEAGYNAGDTWWTALYWGCVGEEQMRLDISDWPAGFTFDNAYMTITYDYTPSGQTVQTGLTLDMALPNTQYTGTIYVGITGCIYSDQAVTNLIRCP